jgi:hypothetical protein
VPTPAIEPEIPQTEEDEESDDDNISEEVVEIPNHQDTSVLVNGITDQPEMEGQKLTRRQAALRGVQVPSVWHNATAQNFHVIRESSERHAYALHISVKKAMQSMPKRAITSMRKELQQMVDKHVWHPMDPSIRHGKKVIKSFMFLKEKFLPDGTWEKLKSRLVAGGHMQDRSEMYSEDISSPTVQLPFLLTIAGIAAKQHRTVRAVDIGGAYLNANISHHEIMMELDPTMSSILIHMDHSYEKYVRPNGTIIVQLDKALYGCVESARLWYNLLAQSLEGIGYTKNPMDPCVFNKDSGSNQSTIVVYVDDLFISTQQDSQFTELMTMLVEKFKEVTLKEGKTIPYLGMVWDFSNSGEVKVTMDGYVSDVLETSNIQGLARTPAGEQLFDLRDADKLTSVEAERFHSIVAKLLYLAKRTRPDILLAISFLTTRVQSSDVDDWKKLERVVKYLRSTPELGIIIRPDEGTVIQVHIDASFGVHHSDGKSHSGMFITTGSGPVLVKSTKQKIVTKSSTEAELVALSDLSSLGLWLRDFLLAQGENPQPVTVYQDNMSTLALINNGGSTSERTRHINIRYFWLKDRIDTGDITPVYRPTEEMIADFFTKPLQGEKFTLARKEVLNWIN